MGRPSPVGMGYMLVTPLALANRLLSDAGLGGVYRAEWQMGLGGGEADVYWVEKVGQRPAKSKRKRRPSRHPVYIKSHDGHDWAECDCKWFVEFRNPSTVCTHILAAVLAHRERN